MKYWEFLIQKEGDETWLPLETQQVEILAGRYRVVAHTDRIDTQMEIRVSQLVTQEMPPRKRVRKRIGQTNDAGLVVVMPYVHLKPGQWELRCSSLNDDESNGASNGAPDWQYQVQLQVFAPTEEDWSDEWPVPADAATAHSSLVEVPAGEATPTGLPEDIPLVQAQAQLKAQLEAQLGRPGQPAPLADATSDDSAYRISLKQQAFLARRNQSMTIMGQVQALGDMPAFEGVSQLWLRLQNPETAQVIMEAHRPLGLDRLPADFKVKIQLPTNVKTRVVLGEVSLRTASVFADEPAKVLSSTAFTITAGIAQLLDEIASRDLGQFEEEIFEPADSQTNALDRSGVEDSVNSQVDHSEPNPVSAILDPTYKPAASAVGVVLPPKLGYNDAPGADANTVDQPELPAFANNHGMPLQVSDTPVSDAQISDEQVNATQADSDINEAGFAASDMPLADTAGVTQPPIVTQPAQFMGTSIEDDDLEASQIAALLEDIDGNLDSQTVGMDELESPGVEAALPETFPTEMNAVDIDQPVDTEESTEPFLPLPESLSRSPIDRRPTQAPEESAPAERFLTRAEIERQQRQQRQSEASTAFKSLKLKDHFWQRLSNLTHESREESAQLAKDMKAAGVEPRTNAGESRALTSLSSNAAAVEDLPANSEVVIYDRANTIDVSAVESPSTVEDTLESAAVAQPAMQSVSASRLDQPSAEEELPEMALPVISVPMGDLIAGGTVTITVRSQPSAYKPFIKLWMIDRQSRTLVGEPKLLTNLQPDALGYLETSTEMRVPMGCLDVQIAAIAVDMATQQESNKAIVNRHVVPSVNASGSLRSFNF